MIEQHGERVNFFLSNCEVNDEEDFFGIGIGIGSIG